MLLTPPLALDASSSEYSRLSWTFLFLPLSRKSLYECFSHLLPQSRFFGLLCELLRILQTGACNSNSNLQWLEDSKIHLFNRLTKECGLDWRGAGGGRITGRKSQLLWTCFSVVVVLTVRMTVLKKGAERIMIGGSEMAVMVYGVIIFRMCHVCTYVYGTIAP
jgi:hypothetical protein